MLPLDRIARRKNENDRVAVLRFDAVAGEWLVRPVYDNGR